jgi:catechol 2,3-dioxygenase-like lactoylglutathione lyase family enzyme
MAIASTQRASVRYLVDDVDRAVDFYTTYLGFTLGHHAVPAFADVMRDPLRLLLSGPTRSGARPIPDGSTPVPGGWNRIHLIVDDITAEVARTRVAGLSFCNNIISGPVGQQILLHDPAGNLVELFHPANRLAAEGVLDAVRPA